MYICIYGAIGYVAKITAQNSRFSGERTESKKEKMRKKFLLNLILILEIN